ncbi:hypothetical protein PVK06_042896 [Gossypium arboreum]|uniref:Reverse transcriptase domain-containing protein n=1 Tax=Gossypium arboreum TaxID=29729 RepID=A0ABR0MM08_GOSAR|nr:hypothetical protein PVK06_042896 [Gossypium arboreum]
MVVSRNFKRNLRKNVAEIEGKQLAGTRSRFEVISNSIYEEDESVEQLDRSVEEGVESVGGGENSTGFGLIDGLKPERAVTGTMGTNNNRERQLRVARSSTSIPSNLQKLRIDGQAHGLVAVDTTVNVMMALMDMVVYMRDARLDFVVLLGTRVWNKIVFGNILRRKRRLIGHLKGDQKVIDGEVTKDLQKLDVKLNTELEQVLNLEELLWKQRSRFFCELPLVAREALKSRVTKVKVKSALDSMAPLKASGLDDIHARFYQSQWDIVGEFVYKIVADTFEGRQLEPTINKMVIHSMRLDRRRSKWMAIKIDLKTAYDRIRWNFLKETLRKVRASYSAGYGKWKMVSQMFIE